MQDQTVFTPTQARQNFFEFIKRAEQGKEVFLKKSGKLMKVKLENVNDKNDIKRKLKALKELSQIGLPSMSIKKMKRIFESRYESHLL
ncbi:hypothetical protein A2767_05485 [Candidatus Roizmanbacteria bacterium RIFCSPHIGHO2_01_FULL_35_10]|uniref:Uncharacterized protein n=1 Tax=Candidatus Roizmanbacteria bacterium RIFCSPLOWO2_01_FULL_35_13 TaxID=1802055 RepID=A0A1F7IBK3_9BACT|nr:MAG: hypothetical protein A2767_05485 [Candidatus Roizmanbacteria bacterium RIFCSPHIGHO2_01_FULL_35_10]OGK40744.1 MAG: hypothetical protein A3A74_03955 [Candidatus Roizmanbacteria bacterium RIFCSPLOWO2_01_FULL_35_13]